MLLLNLNVWKRQRRIDSVGDGTSKVQEALGTFIFISQVFHKAGKHRYIYMYIYKLEGIEIES